MGHHPAGFSTSRGTLLIIFVIRIHKLLDGETQGTGSDNVVKGRGSGQELERRDP